MKWPTLDYANLPMTESILTLNLHCLFISKIFFLRILPGRLGVRLPKLNNGGTEIRLLGQLHIVVPAAVQHLRVAMI